MDIFDISVIEDKTKKVVFAGYPFDNECLKFKIFPKFQKPSLSCLGHEVFTIKSRVIGMLMQGIITQNDIIVTSEDRKFIYSKLFTTLSYKEFLNREKDFQGYKPINLTNLFDNPAQSRIFLEEEPEFTSKYLAFDYEKVNEKKPFVLIHIKNLKELDPDTKEWTDVFDKLVNLVPEGIKIFTFSNNKNIKSLSELELSKKKNVKFISSLRTYCSLMNNERCIAVFGVGSGATILPFVCGHSNIKILCFKEDHLYPQLRFSINGFWIHDHFDTTCIPGVKIYIFKSLSNLVDVISYTKLNFDKIDKVHADIINKLYNIPKIPKDFDWIAYSKLNSDLKIKSKSAAILHYVKIGYKEGRKYKY